MITVNYFAIIVASIVNVVLGMAWYGPLFGRYWMNQVGLSDADRNRPGTQGAMMRSTAISFVLALIMNYVLSAVVVFMEAYTGSVGWVAGLTAGFWMWLGFILISNSGTYLWEGKPLKLWAVYSGYYLVLLLINGAILGGWV